MHPSSTFDYTAVLPADWPGTAHCTCRDTSWTGGKGQERPRRLLGTSPTLTLDAGELRLEADPSEDVQNKSYHIKLDGTLRLALRAGDTLRLVRTGAADHGLHVWRSDKIACALGSVLHQYPELTIADIPSVICGKCESRSPADEAFCTTCGAPQSMESQSQEDPFVRAVNTPEAFVQLDTGSEMIRLGGGDYSEIAGFEVTVLQGFRRGFPGSPSTMAVSRPSFCRHEVAVAAARALVRSA